MGVTIVKCSKAKLCFCCNFLWFFTIVKYFISEYFCRTPTRCIQHNMSFFSAIKDDTVFANLAREVEVYI